MQQRRQPVPESTSVVGMVGAPDHCSPETATLDKTRPLPRAAVGPTVTHYFAQSFAHAPSSYLRTRERPEKNTS